MDQEIINEVLCQMMPHLSNDQLRLENEKHTKLRDSLLPKLMSGELDVSELEI